MKYEIEEWPTAEPGKFIAVVDGKFLGGVRHGMIEKLDHIRDDHESRLGNIYQAATFKNREECLDYLKRYKAQWEVRGIKKETIKL